jgi:hypothetical protein
MPGGCRRDVGAHPGTTRAGKATPHRPVPRPALARPRTGPVKRHLQRSYASQGRQVGQASKMCSYVPSTDHVGIDERLDSRDSGPASPLRQGEALHNRFERRRIGVHLVQNTRTDGTGSSIVHFDTLTGEDYKIGPEDIDDMRHDHAQRITRVFKYCKRQQILFAC